MLKVASRARRFLGDSATRVERFLLSQLAERGGFLNRGGDPDLYYTGFGGAALAALGRPLARDRARPYLESLPHPSQLDLVHLASLARCHAHLDPPGVPHGIARQILRRLREFALPDGGFTQRPETRTPTIYAAFLAAQIVGDLRFSPPDPSPLLRSILSLRAPDGGWLNEPGGDTGATAPAAASVTLLHAMRQPIPADAVDWIAARHSPRGGFTSSPLVILPDLLSTAVSLHALAIAGHPLDAFRKSTLDFIGSLWDNRGGFCAHWADGIPDAEYTFYGLLALGHLAHDPGSPRPLP